MKGLGSGLLCLLDITRSLRTYSTVTSLQVYERCLAFASTITVSHITGGYGGHYTCGGGTIGRRKRGPILNGSIAIGETQASPACTSANRMAATPRSECICIGRFGESGTSAALDNKPMPSNLPRWDGKVRSTTSDEGVIIYAQLGRVNAIINVGLQ